MSQPMLTPEQHQLIQQLEEDHRRRLNQLVSMFDRQMAEAQANYERRRDAILYPDNIASFMIVENKWAAGELLIRISLNSGRVVNVPVPDWLMEADRTDWKLFDIIGRTIYWTALRKAINLAEVQGDGTDVSLQQGADQEPDNG